MKELFAQELERLRAAGLYRSLRTVAGEPGREIDIAGANCLNFSSNNYLGLSGHPAVREAAAGAIERFGCGGTASRLIAGTLEIHRRLEERLARLKGKEAALVFPSGFQTNAGVIGSLVTDGDCVVMDRLNHASLWDAAKLSGARVFVYAHRDPASLEKVLGRARAYRRKLVVTDSVFSMDGDLAPLREIADIARRSGAWTMIDEAHATGIFGPGGRGLAARSGVEDGIDIVMGTLSKALGSQGGFVCGPRELIEYLVNRCRPFIYTTALAPSCAAAALAAIDVTEREPGRGGSLLRAAASLRDALRGMGFDTLDSESQIIPVVTGSIEATMRLSGYLLERGIYAPAIRPPTVPGDQCRLRLSLTSELTAADVDRLMKTLRETEKR